MEMETEKKETKRLEKVKNWREERSKGWMK